MAKLMDDRKDPSESALVGGASAIGGVVGRSIAADQPARAAVIAEIGVNHDGDASVAGRLIDAAAQAGADAVKFQYFRPERLLSKQAELAGYQAGSADSQHELLSKLTLSLEVLGELVAYARRRGLGAVVTPFSPDDPAELAGLVGRGLVALKTASPDAVNPVLLRSCAAVGLPLLISTGTCAMDELAFAGQLLLNHQPGGALLHCVSSYPTPMHAAQLGGIAGLREHFGVAVGYSDHTAGLHTGALALAAGAIVLEKHLTHDRLAQGPDHAASLDPAGFKAYVQQVREAEAAMGVKAKQVGELEQDVRRVSRQSVCAARDLQAGCVLSAEDLTVKRPGTGIAAADYDRVLGRELARAVAANTLLSWDDLAG